MADMSCLWTDGLGERGGGPEGHFLQMCYKCVAAGAGSFLKDFSPGWACI
jgi:hypothetical protein